MANQTVTHSTVDRVRTIGEMLFFGLGTLLFGSVMGSFVIVLLETVGIRIPQQSARSILVGTFAIQGITFFGMGAAYLFYTDHGRDLIDAHVPDFRDIGYLVGGTIALFICLIGLSVISQLLGIKTAQSVVTKPNNPTLFLLLIPISIILVGPAEELIFRGIVQGRLRQVFGPVLAIVLASLIFASIHLPGLLGNDLTAQIATVSIVFILALVLGSLYELSGNLLVPALVHGLYNAFQFFIQYLRVTGGLPGS